MHARASRSRVFQWGVPIAITALVVTALFAVGVDPITTALGNPSAQSAQQSTVHFRVEPTVINWPDERERNPEKGFWLVASGLEPGQEVQVQMQWGSSRTTSDLTSWIMSSAGDAGALLAANDTGSFVVPAEFRPDRMWLFWGSLQSAEFGSRTLFLVDAETRDVLATTPIIVCSPGDRENEENWCALAEEVLPIEYILPEPEESETE